MTDEKMADVVQALVNDDRFNDFIDPYLDIAKQAIVSRRFPYRDDAVWDDVPEKYHMIACEIAVYLINRRGSEGETSHSESGTSRTYESAGIPDSLIRCIVPVVGVP